MDIENIIVDSSISIRKALKQLDEVGKGFLGIYKEDDIYGIITDGDIRRAILNNVSLDNSIDVIANTKFIFLHPDSSQNVIVNTFIENPKIQHVPIVKDGKLIKVISKEDLLGIKNNAKRIIDTRVVVMAGGRGTRLLPLTNIIPKPLLPLGDQSVLEVIIQEYGKYGINEFTISVNYKASLIKAYLEEIDHKYRIDYIEEKKPLGTAGSLKLLNRDIQNIPFFVANCDIIIKDDYADIYDFHKNRGYDITIVASLLNHTVPYGVCIISDGGTLIRIDEKPELDLLVNTGMYVINPSILELIPDDTFYHITHLINDVKRNGGKVGVYPVSEKAWFDIGQWDQYSKTINLYNL